MPIKYDATGIDTSKGKHIPDGEYKLAIVKAVLGESKHKEPQVVVDAVVSGGPHDNYSVRHYVTFKNDKKDAGAGIALHFLKTIGQSWEGEIEINEENWIGKSFIAWLEADEYNGWKKMRIKWVKSTEEIEEVPF